MWDLTLLSTETDFSTTGWISQDKKAFRSHLTSLSKESLEILSRLESGVFRDSLLIVCQSRMVLLPPKRRDGLY